MRRVLWLVPLGVLGLLAALIAWHGTIPYPDAHYDFADHERYLSLAQQPFGSRDPLAQEAPFRWRLVVPLVVWVLHTTLGLPLTTGFWLLTLLGLASATLALWWLLEGLGLSGEVRLAGTLAFVLLGPAVAFNLWLPYLVDPLALAIAILIMALAVHRIWWPLPLLAVVGAATKETTLLVLVCALVLAWSTRDRAGMVLSSIGVGLAGLVLGALHLLLPAAGGWTVARTFQISLGQSASHLPYSLPVITLLLLSYRLLGVTVGAWLLLFPLALVALLWRRSPWRPHVAWVLLGIAGLAQVFVNTDNDRHAVLVAAPAFVLAACLGVERLTTRWRCSRWAIWGPVLVIQAYWSLGYAAWDGLPVRTSMGTSERILPLFGFLGHERELLTVGVLLLTVGMLLLTGVVRIVAIAERSHRAAAAD